VFLFTSAVGCIV